MSLLPELGVVGWLADAVGFSRAISLGQRIFSATEGASGAIAENVVQKGATLTFENFTIVSRAKGADLLAPAKQILDLAAKQGATKLRFTGTFSNAELAAKFGMRIGDAFDITVDATRSGIIDMLRMLK